MSEQQPDHQQQQSNPSQTSQQIPQMPVDPSHPTQQQPPPPGPPRGHGQPMMVLNRLTPIQPQFIIPQHPSQQPPPYHHPHSTFPPPPPPPRGHGQSTNGQSMHGHPHPHPHGHPRPPPPPHGFHNQQYIPVRQVHGLPPNVLLTPIHGPPPGVSPQNVRFIGSNFNVPPVQTIYSTNNNNNNNNKSKTPPSGSNNEHKNNNQNPNDTSINNIRKQDLLPINPNNNIYANSQQIAQSNPNQTVLPHVRNTLNNNQNNNNNNQNGVQTLQPINQPTSRKFGYSEYQTQMKRISNWNNKKHQQEKQLSEMENNNTIGIPHNNNNENITGRAHFIPSNNNNNNNDITMMEYGHIGYDPNKYNNNSKKRKRSSESQNDIEYSETDEEDYDINDLLDDDSTSDEELIIKTNSNSNNKNNKNNGGSGPPKKKRKYENNNHNNRRISKTERKKQYTHYMKQFEGIEESLDRLQPIEPSEDFKKTRKEYMGLSNLIVEKILHRREYIHANTGLPKYEYYVLYKYLSYLHCEWISEDILLSETKGNSKIKRFIKLQKCDWMEGIELFDINYSTVDRILSARPGPGYNIGDTRFEYFVKFNGLNYSDCRWEFADDIDDDNKILQFQQRSLIDQKIWEPKIRPRSNFYKPLCENINYKDNNKLHEWQIEGVNWLCFNWYNRRGGILADEMGLGKTIQVIATLSKLSEVYCSGPFLIVAPLSTIGHWKREIESWTDLNVVCYQGNKEDRRICHFFEFRYFDSTGRRLIHNDIYKFNILLTTYESVMLDDELVRIKWKVLIVDEAHRLKNNESKLSKFLRKCQIEHSILLTGTPIQNNIRELWNLLNFVDNGTFFSYKSFDEKYGELTQKNNNGGRDGGGATMVSDLQTLIKPYFLRRLKEDVAKFIPEKQETIIEVELTRIQKQYYRALLEKNREFLYRGVSNRNAPKLMNIANDLRKICNHPYLISGAYQRITCDSKTMEEKINIMISSSGKFILLNKLLPKLKSGGNKVLIFSQWRITLDWIEEYLRRKHYIYERIDGNITGNSRQAAIDRFCSPNSNSFIFLLTTKAGGVGLNLTAADTVIINDSDWNPQNDIQAMARCHRIGQNKSVKVYRLITSRSYEKEMFIKASKKLGLGQAIMEGNNHANILGNKEINELLKYGAYHVFQDDDKECDQFCEENIDEILAKRSKSIKYSSNSCRTNNFSRATFKVGGSNANDINLDDKDFWEKILPKELSPNDMIELLENGSVEKNDVEFWKHLTRQVEEVKDLRERGMLSTQIQTVIKLLQIVANSPSVFTNEKRIKAQDWANYIENPRRYTRQKKNAQIYNEDDVFLPSTHKTMVKITIKQTVYKTKQFTPKEVELLIKLFFNIFSTSASNIFIIIYNDFIKLMAGSNNNDGWKKRSLREITGWCNAFVLYLSTELHDTRDKNAFVDVKHAIKKLMPKDFHDSGSNSNRMDIDNEEYSPTNNKRRRRRGSGSRKLKLPRNCQIIDFPSFDEKWFTRMINKSSTSWAKRMRLSVLLRQRIRGKNIKINSGAAIKIPQHIGGNKPCKWWDINDDKHLLIGAATHGISNWTAIRQDKSLGFMHKINSFSTTNNNNSNKMHTNNNNNNSSSKDNILLRKCCGINTASELDLQCDGCEDFLHGKCCDIKSVEQIPSIWFCFECNGLWPNNNILYDRLAAILHAMKKTSSSSIINIKSEQKTNSSSHNNKNYSHSHSKRTKLNNSRTRVGRMWNFSLKEMHALQRTVQIYGKISWYELKTKSKSPKTEEQVESYFYSFMSNVEYLIRCERLKELIVSGKIELPVALQEKFCRPAELIKAKSRRQRYTHSTPSVTPPMEPINQIIPPSLSPSIITKSNKNISSNNNNNIPLPDLIKGECLSMVTDILNDNIISKHFASFSNKKQEDSLTLSDIYRKIELDQYYNPKQIFNHIQCMIDDKLSKSNNNKNEEILLCINKINQLSNKYKQNILSNFNKTNCPINILMPPPPPPPLPIQQMPMQQQQQQQQHHYVNYNRFKIKKTDMDMLSESDVEKYFGLKKPDSIVNHQLTVNLANKVWQRAQMWVHLRKVQDIAGETLSKLYNIVKAQRNEPGTNSKLPEWWHPPKHDKLVISLILKHGMQQTPDLVLSDFEFKKQIDVKEHKDFLNKFFVPTKPLILRLRYVAYVLTHGGEEPTRDTWHYNSLHEIQGQFYYKPIQTREDYQRDMNEWFERNEINTNSMGNGSNCHSHSPTPCSSIDLGLLSSKSPRRTGKSSELIERYRTLSRDEDGDLIFPIQAKQGASIINLGEVVYDRKLFSSSKYIWPNGFESQRIHPSYLEPSQRVIYTSKIIDAGDRPKFAVIASDDPDNPIIANSASTAWTNVITKVNYAKDPDKRRKTCTVSGPEMFGYNDPLIIALIEELPNARKVIPYWKNRTPFREVLQDAFIQD